MDSGAIRDTGVAKRIVLTPRRNHSSAVQFVVHHFTDWSWWIYIWRKQEQLIYVFSQCRRYNGKNIIEIKSTLSFMEILEVETHGKELLPTLPHAMLKQVRSEIRSRALEGRLAGMSSHLVHEAWSCEWRFQCEADPVRERSLFLLTDAMQRVSRHTLLLADNDLWRCIYKRPFKVTATMAYHFKISALLIVVTGLYLCTNSTLRI